MLLATIPAYKYFVTPNPEWSTTITSFASCSKIVDETETKTYRMMKIASLGIYTLSEMLYSIVILRMFVANVLRLSIFCQTSSLEQQQPVKSITDCSHCIFFL